MCKSVESLIEVINDNLKNNSTYIQKDIKEISNIKNIEDYNNVNELENLSDDLSHSLKIIKRLKLLKNKLNRIKSEIDELSMFAYKPERIETDDELEWEEEEQQIKTSNINNIPLILESES